MSSLVDELMKMPSGNSRYSLVMEVKVGCKAPQGSARNLQVDFGDDEDTHVELVMSSRKRRRGQ